MSRFLTLTLLFALVAISIAGPKRAVHVNNPNQQQKKDLKWWTESKAPVLTSKSFESLVGKDKYVVIQFCATFSKECEAIQGEYNTLAEMYSGANPKQKDVSIVKIDGWTFNSLSQTYSVKRFPTIRFFNKNDATNSEEYTGGASAAAMSEWIEGLIKAKEAPKTEEKQPEETKKAEEPKKTEEKKPEEPKKEEVKKEEAKKEDPPKQADSIKTEEDVKKEFKLVLNTTLLQAQFDEVQNQLNKLSEALNKNIAENFKKVEALQQSFESHKNEFKSLADSLRGHGDKLHELGNSLDNHKEDIKSSVTRHAEDHLTHLKDSVSSIKNKVYEKRAEEPSGSSFLHIMIYVVIGGALGAGAVFMMSGGNKKRRSMLD